jgi:tripartite-type tricarboxylate transporter receptor subunit TctC
VAELIALAKAKPGVLNYASSSRGSANHLAAELFKFMADVNIVRVAYKGTPLALADVLNGQVQLMFATAVSVMPHVKAGKLRALAVTSLQPSQLAAGLPTMAASGLPGYEAIGLTGMLAPATTPRAIITQLNREVVRVLAQSDVKERLLATGAEPVGNSPEEFAAIIKAQVAKMSKLIKEAGIEAD